MTIEIDMTKAHSYVIVSNYQKDPSSWNHIFGSIFAAPYTTNDT